MNKFSRNNSQSSRNATSTGAQQQSNGEANEHTSLLGRIVHNNHLVTYTQDERAWVRWPTVVLETTWEVLRSNYANVFLVFVPLGIIAGATGWDPTTIFILNFLAIIPLAGLLAFATEELSAKLGQTIGGLMNATFGNAVELIVSIVALREGQIRIVQASMLGSILSNILLVLGCCFIAGGLKKDQQNFDITVASTMSSLMAVASASLVIPATLYMVMKKSSEDAAANVLLLSHGTAIILLFLYCAFLFFQLYSHAHLFDVEAEAEAEPADPEQQETGGKKEGETLPPVSAAIALILITICVAICAEYLVDSIDAIVEKAHISKTFIGLILLPIVGNAAEHVTAVVVSYKNKMDLALGVAIGSSMQIALFVTPFLVILGWIIGQPMTLNFEPFETIVFFLSVLVVNYLIQDGKSNYLEGLMCLGTYTIIALAFYVYPDDAGDLGGALAGNLISP